MRGSLATFVLFGFIFSLSPAHAETWTDPRFGGQLTYPNDWTLGKLPQKLASSQQIELLNISDPDGKLSIVVNFLSLSGSGPLDQKSPEVQNLLRTLKKQHGNPKIETSVINGRKFLVIHYVERLPEETDGMIVWLTPITGGAYEITGKAVNRDPDHSLDLSNIINSFTMQN